MRMDTSTPAPDNGGRAWRVDSIAAQVQAIDELCLLARERIEVFDVDLSATGWDTLPRIELLARFLRQRDARLDVIVHDTRWIEAHGARLLGLLRSYGHAMTLYRTGPEALSAMDPLLLVDRRHYLHRFHVTQPRATAAIDRPLEAKPLVTRFAEIWATGEPGLSATVLGL
jgi:hypothetical protein